MLVKSIMIDSKNSKNKLVFAKGIPKLQWKAFEDEELSFERTKPNPSMTVDETKKMYTTE